MNSKSFYKLAQKNGFLFFQAHPFRVGMKVTNPKNLDGVEIFNGKFVTVGPNELGVEISGRASQIDNFMNMVSDIGIIDMARSGRVAISRAKS